MISPCSCWLREDVRKRRQKIFGNLFQLSWNWKRTWFTLKFVAVDKAMIPTMSWAFADVSLTHLLLGRQTTGGKEQQMKEWISRCWLQTCLERERRLCTTDIYQRTSGLAALPSCPVNRWEQDGAHVTMSESVRERPLARQRSDFVPKPKSNWAPLGHGGIKA